MVRLLNNKIAVAFTLLAIILCVGTLGFHFVSEYSWIDALYMTVITISTVGFGEVEPFDTWDKLFTVFLIVVSVVAFAFSISVITEYIFRKSNPEEAQARKYYKMIQNLKDHIIIIGYGRNGRQAVAKLLAYKKPFVIIDRNRETIERFQSEDILFVEGNATEDEVLVEAGIKKAVCVICTLPDDADNVFIVLSCRQLNKDLKIISRASQDTSYKKLRLAGADNVIMPDRIGGDHMASLVVVPDLIEFLDNLSIVGKRSINIREIDTEAIVRNGNTPTIKDLNMRSRTGCSIIGYKSPEGEYIVNPEADMQLLPGSKIVILGRPEQIQALNLEFEL